MKSIFVAGSRKFHSEIEKFLQACEKNGIKAQHAGKWEGGSDTFESESKALLTAFGRIESSDILYIFSGGGYIGKTVALEIAYAYAKAKEIISTEEIEDFSARALVSKTLSPEKLIEYIKS
jgi:hypothetical protein